MTAPARKRANAALLPTVQVILDLYRRGVRGPSWHRAMARLDTTARLLDAKGPSDA